MSLEVVEETLLSLQENQRDILLELGVPVSRWCSQFLISSRKIDSPICGDCNNTADATSFTLRTALLAIPFVSDLCGVDIQ